MEDTRACSGGDGAAGPWHPMGLEAQTVNSTQLRHTAEPPVTYQGDCSVRSSAYGEFDLSADFIRSREPSCVLSQGRETLNPEIQVAPQSAGVDNSCLPIDETWRARYKEINRLIESGHLNQAEAVELALRTLSAEGVPGDSRPLDSAERLGNLFVSNTGSSPVCSNSDASTLPPSSGFISGKVQMPSRYLLRRSNHDGPEVTA